MLERMDNLRKLISILSDRLGRDFVARTRLPSVEACVSTRFKVRRMTAVSPRLFSDAPHAQYRGMCPGSPTRARRPPSLGSAPSHTCPRRLEWMETNGSGCEEIGRAHV